MYTAALQTGEAATNLADLLGSSDTDASYMVALLNQALGTAA